MKSNTTKNNISPIIRSQLFIGSCFALIATSVAFAIVGDIMVTLKEEFILTNLEIGYIGGAALWGFAVSNIIFSPLCDTLGMRFLFRLAFIAHFIGVFLMVFATGFFMLFIGALIIAMGNGLVEAAGNPLVATLFPKEKTIKLNQFHVWFPGGAVIGGLSAYGLTQLGLGYWELKLGLILIFTITYGFLLLKQEFPDTETVQSGITVKEIFKTTFTSPLFLLMLLCMALTASIELGPNRWIPAVLQSGGIPGILVLVWISGLMAILRYYAKGLINRLSPTLVLLISSVISGVGLLWLSYAETTLMAFVSATLFAVGVTYFWPTMLGFVNERIPKTGALGLGLMGGTGMAVVGLITSPLMGNIADYYSQYRMPYDDTKKVIIQSIESLPGLALHQNIPEIDIKRATDIAKNALDKFDDNIQKFPPLQTANALRAIVDTRAEAPYIQEAARILGKADNYGGRVSFRYIAPVSIILIIIFSAIFIIDRKKGGYKIIQIRDEA